MPQRTPPIDLIRAEFQNRHSGLLTDLLVQYTRFVEESPPIGERQMPERLQHLLRMVRVTGRNFLNEHEAQYHDPRESSQYVDRAAPCEQRARRGSGDRHANGGCKGGPDQGA